ncbi:MAG: tetratricopeptide repeat protein [Erythrobacter sp.]|jgi:Flp pilus assembly protein TadD|nr:tetratricopeptide repeat protein [Erythrobacter sp.]
MTTTHSISRFPAALAVLTLAVGLAIPAPLGAQVMTSRPVTQPLPAQDTQRLNRALVELAKQPRNLAALLEAGDAALGVGDLDAALGFFTTARDVEPEEHRALLGLARVYLRAGRPTAALPLFTEAEEAGASLRAVRSDKALAFDMVGDQARAQRLYNQLLVSSPNDDEARRRLAVSYAISNNLAGFEATLRPLVDRRDFAAFRARAFGLAIMGEQNRAAAITDAVMPRELAAKVTPYLEFMPRLTPSQQAAAASLGIFPKAAEIGRDTPEIAAWEKTPSSIASASGAKGADRLLEPSGPPLGTRAPEPVPARAPVRVEDAFGDMIEAGSANGPVLREAGAVDIAAIEIPREAPPPEPEPAPKHPARIWVQLATGRDLRALGFDWRRFARTAPELLAPFKAHTVPWGEANRLLAGPLDSVREAQALVTALKEKGIDTFRFNSPEGLEIQRLDTP